VIQTGIAQQHFSFFNGVEQLELMLLGMQDGPWMWMESEQHRFTVQFLCSLSQQVNDCAMPNVHAIERSDG
jgi:hypothetical protein